MLELMQNRPLLISNLVDYVATWHAETEIVSRDPQGVMHRSNYGQVAARAKRVANALAALGVGQGDRVATLAWNSWRHLELYYGVTCSGRVLHTVNPRLFAEQLVYIINHAENGYVFFDPDFTPLVERLAPSLPLVRGWVVLCDEKDMPAVKVDNLLCYETLLARCLARLCLAATRREHRLHALLHVRHDRQSQGRALQPSLDRIARLCRLRGRRLRAVGEGFHPGDRAAVSRQCVEPAVLGGDVRRQAGAARSAARSGKHLSAARAGRLHQGGRHSDHLAQLPRLCREQPRKLDLVEAEAEAGLQRAALRRRARPSRNSGICSASSCCTPGA